MSAVSYSLFESYVPSLVLSYIYSFIQKPAHALWKLKDISGLQLFVEYRALIAKSYWTGVALILFNFFIILMYTTDGFSTS